MTLSHTREKSDIISGDFMVRLRGHWLSNTRKLNGHYQSAKKTLILPVETWPYGVPIDKPIHAMMGPDGEWYYIPQQLAPVKYITNNNQILNSDFEILRGESLDSTHREGFFVCRDVKFDTYAPNNPEIGTVSMPGGGIIYDGPDILSTDLRLNFIIPVYDVFMYLYQYGNYGKDFSFLDNYEMTHVNTFRPVRINSDDVEEHLAEFCAGLYPTGGFDFPPGFSMADDKIITGIGVKGDGYPILDPSRLSVDSWNIPLTFDNYGNFFHYDNTQTIQGFDNHDGLNLGYWSASDVGQPKNGSKNIQFGGNAGGDFIIGQWIVIRRFEAYKKHPFNALYQGG